MGIREERKEEILKAAIFVFAKSGFDGAKIEDIAKEAGIGKGTVYEYFESKKHLFEEMIEYNVEQYIKSMRNALAEGKTVREKLIFYSKFQTEFLLSHIDIFHSVQNNVLSQELKKRVFEKKLSIGKEFEGLVEEGIKSGELRTDLDKELAAFCILGTLGQFSATRIFLKRMKPHDINHEAIVDVILNGVKQF